jgi:hypothetical protein
MTLIDNVLHEPPTVENDVLHPAFENNAVVDLHFTVTDGNGDSVTNTINITINDDMPVATESANVFFVSDYAGYNNVIGTYEIGENGTPINMKVLVASTNSEVHGDMGTVDHQLAQTIGAGEKVFIIANGAGAYHVGDSITYDATNHNIYYMDSELNSDGHSHFQDGDGNNISAVPTDGGEIHIEDLPYHSSDLDYDDAVLRVEKGPTVSESNLADGTHTDANTHLTVTGNFFTDNVFGHTLLGADNIEASYPEGYSGPTPSVTVNGNYLALDGNAYHTITIDGIVPGATHDSAGELTIHGDGSWSYTLVDNTLEHTDNDAGGHDHSDGDSNVGSGDQVHDVFNVIVTDADGDSVTSNLVININDDGPVVNEDAQNTVLANVDDIHATANLGIVVGADIAGSSVELSNVTHSCHNGLNFVINTENGEHVTSDGHNLVYESDGHGGIDAVVQGTHDVIFSVTPNIGEDGSTSYTTTMYGTVDTQHVIDHYDNVTENVTYDYSSSTHVDSGNGDYYNVIFTNDEGDKIGAKVTAVTDDDGHQDGDFYSSGPDANGKVTIDVDTNHDVNVSQQRMGVDNQFIDNYDDGFHTSHGHTVPDSQNDNDGELLKFEFHDVNSSGHLTTELVNVNSVDLTVDQLDAHHGQQPLEVANWTAIDNTGTVVSEVATGTLDGTSQGACHPSDQPLHIEDTTDGTTFDTVYLGSEPGSDYGVLFNQTSITVPETTTVPVYADVPIVLDFTAVVTDGDGDTTFSDVFTVTLDGDNVLAGGPESDVIVGSDANEILTGGAGDDVLIGDGGVDAITGGAGSDTFITSEVTSHEVVDFTPGAPDMDISVLVPPLDDVHHPI